MTVKYQRDLQNCLAVWSKLAKPAKKEALKEPKIIRTSVGNFTLKEVRELVDRSKKEETGIDTLLNDEAAGALIIEALLKLLNNQARNVKGLIASL